MAKQKNYDEKPELGDIVGLPDDWDKKNITNLIRNFETAFPGAIKENQIAAKAEYEKTRAASNKYGELIKSSGTRHIMTLPNALVREIEEAYPLMFRDKNHFEWFVKNFNDLVLPEAY